MSRKQQSKRWRDWRPVDEPLPHDVADQKKRDPMFRGRCYLCGAHCTGVFCHAHQWASR